MDAAQVAARKLAVDGLLNARDLGGLPAPGGLTRSGVVVRSEAPSRVGVEGRAQLERHGVNGYLDLRTPREVEEEPNPFASDRRYRLAPLLDEPAMEHVRGLSDPADLFDFMLEARAEAIAAALRELVELAGGGGVLVHCRAGKDRTGVVAALLLAAAGVATPVIGADHALTAHNIEPLYGYWADRARTDSERALISRRRFPATSASIIAALDHLIRRHGRVGSYLRGAGLSAAEIGAVSDLLSPAASAPGQPLRPR